MKLYAAILLLLVSQAEAASLYLALAPIVGEHKPFTESGISLEHKLEKIPLQLYATKAQASNIFGVEAVTPFPQWSQSVELFIGFAYQDTNRNYIVGSHGMYSFGFSKKLTKSISFKFRHQSNGAYLHGPLCNPDCDNRANSGYNWIGFDLAMF